MTWKYVAANFANLNSDKSSWSSGVAGTPMMSSPLAGFPLGAGRSLKALGAGASLLES